MPPDIFAHSISELCATAGAGIITAPPTNADQILRIPHR
jgi:hypothetical protein